MNRAEQTPLPARPRRDPSGAPVGDRAVTLGAARSATLLSIPHLVLRRVLDAALPRVCIVCRARGCADGDECCPACRDSIEPLAALPYCERCGRSAQTAAIRERECGWCAHESYWNVRRLVRIGPYDSPLRDPVLSLKFGGNRRCANYLGGLLADVLEGREWVESLDALVPVPMHMLRRVQRKCNHAAMLAQTLSRRIGVPLLHALRRTRYTVSQTRAATRGARFTNVAGSFGVRRRMRISGKRLCIIDNVLTSGATLHEVSKTLRRAGAARIDAAVIARAGMPGVDQASSDVLVTHG